MRQASSKIVRQRRPEIPPRLLCRCQAKTSLKKVMDSILQQCGKMRSAIRDIKNSASVELKEPGPCIEICPPLQLSHLETLQKQLKIMDGQYDVCNETMAKGEMHGFKGSPLDRKNSFNMLRYI